MNQQYSGPCRYPFTTRLGQIIVLPGDALYGVGYGASSLLVNQRHSVGKPQYVHAPFPVQLSSVTQSYLYQEGVAGIYGHRSDCGDNEVQTVLFL